MQKRTVVKGNDINKSSAVAEMGDRWPRAENWAPCPFWVGELGPI